MKNLRTLLIISCLASLALGCTNTCPSSGGPGECTNNGEFQPVKIQYSANGICLNVEIGSNGNGNTTPPVEYEKCGSCSGVPYGRVPLDGDCSKFCECIQGKHSKIDSCPPKLEFNAKKQVCDYPEDAGCSSENVTLPPPTDDTYYCESCSGITYGFVAFEKNCSKFCECLKGEVSKVKDCQVGLLFNKEISNCDYAGNTDCQDRPTDSTPIVTESTPNTPTPEKTPSTPPGNTASTPTIVTPVGDECIKCTNVGYGVVGDRNDCRKFCICFNHDGVQVETCSEGLHFNEVTEVCEYDTEGACINTPTITPEETTTLPPPNVPDGTNGNCKLCDQANLGQNVPIEGDCTKYCVCQYYSNQGRNTIVTCPGGLYFNSTLQVCDWPLNSGCVQP